MDSLQKAYEARSKKLNKIEEVKELKNPQDAFDKLGEYAKNGYDSIPDEDKKYFLKCFGIYDRPATPQMFMIKLRIPGGYLNSTQAREIGECALAYGQDYIDLTTRSQCELRYLDIKDIPTILQRLKNVGIDSYQTGVDNFRNIMTDPLDALGFDNVLPSYELLLKLQKTFLYSPEWISTLPRKFNTSITGSLSNRCNVFGHDCCFVLAQKDGCYGYNMYLGGKVGKIAKSADIFLANEDEVVKAFESITDLFKRFGFRDNRNKNRLHFLIDVVGMDEISSAIRENAGIDFARAGETMTKMDFNDPDQGKVQLRDGSFAVHVVVPSGVFTGSGMIEVANLSETYGNKEIRFDMEQSLYILGVKDVNTLLSEEFFEKYKSVNSPYFNHLIACAGTQHCPFGVIENKNDAINMATYLDEKVPLEKGRVRMYWSACVKGCGIHGLGDIGFEGCKTKVDGEAVGGVNISLGGQLVSEGVEGYTVLKSTPLKYAHFYVETLMLEYKKHKKADENFEQFHTRVLKQYTPASIGFMMKLGAYLRDKGIDIDFGFNDKTYTGKNEEFELFEIGRRLFYALTKREAYSAYDRFTNVLKNEKLENIRTLVENMDENIALMLEKILDEKEQNRAVVFSEISSFISIYES
ncbi:ferrodoxin nitrite/sulfite reductase [Sulfurimonas gotlandica GD1]|uniref:Ferrodoxin nitrite/sulfite reductase n=1 Tax=Sulfurimonas gotlandica (strain DSM 19862 / JCM 16533 / GD1) TaxID=929558 RepID=B6BNX4_SULGG|nr:ferredoxin--nitrite reductase [Sulfurimonas gotlandica]EDZ61183.1 ferredoxin-nitrite reductase, putative [Sulfurimonas gotlandica GD1]EHP28929.1 ferrodoxin nitrite/sulfite reductase [Sulfurimonas gotlandica GD1]